MGAKPTGLSAEELENLDWSEILRRLTAFALKRLRSRGSLADAEDLAQEAVTRFLDPKYAGWDRDREPDLLRHLGSILNGVLNNRVRLKSFAAEEPNDEIIVNATDCDEPLPEARVAATEDLNRSISLISARISGDKLVEDILLLSIDGINDASAQSAHLRVSISEIYNARRRLAAHRDAVRRQVSTEAPYVGKRTN